MRRIISFLILQLTLVSCSLQKPAPVLLKGEEFYGKRDLEYIREYYLIKEEIDSLIRKENKKALNKIDRKNKKDTQNIKINLENCKFIMPVKGTAISSDKTCKDGIKIVAQSGINVVASAPGKVIYVGKGLRWYGNLIILEHKDNYMTTYSYLKNINVEIGDKVKQGQIIGSAGKLSTQDKNLQMCFTIRRNGQAVDPLMHINCN
ncbi:murein hydrolase activator EnvC family protein [Wolbachia endosymbiont of Dipetalonema caudispina]|uniref:murein hydrolase activator EnvC family protein n=1 Tax=Wolbachia endosymbiont of Dipetalonema caudispina TaxID=1812112 RepID=UPI002101E110|nr:M23 family metallopeptidase [Wolbachia endosymbiont of Dipetalonema caudispina]